MAARVERVVTSGAVPLDSGEEHKVNSNVWIVGDDAEVIVVDAAHDTEAVLSAVDEREILAVICTHGSSDHVNVALPVADRDEAPIALHPRDRVLWDATYPDDDPDLDIEHGGVFEVAGERLEVLHTPGCTPGGIALYAEGLGAVFTGETLIKGGPGAPEGSYADLPTLLTSIGEHLLTLPGDTRVLPARGEETTVGAEDEDFDAWISDPPPKDAGSAGGGAAGVKAGAQDASDTD